MAIKATAERDLLLGRLGGQRQHVLTQLEGLSDKLLRQPVKRHAATADVEIGSCSATKRSL